MSVFENLVPGTICLVKGMFGTRIKKLWKNKVLTKFSVLATLITNSNNPYSVLGQNPLEVMYSSAAFPLLH